MKWDSIADAYLALGEDRDKLLIPIIKGLIHRNGIKKIVDIGCGDGRFLDFICKEFGRSHFTSISAWDSSEIMRARATDRLSRSINTNAANRFEEVKQNDWDLVLFIAVWMGLDSHSECVETLQRLRKLLAHGGRIFAAVTHPCFRDRTFRTFSTNFDMSNYFASGSPFRVNIYDSSRSLAIVDTHWTLSDHIIQAAEAGLVLESLIEVSDLEASAEGAPWLVFVFRGD